MLIAACNGTTPSNNTNSSDCPCASSSNEEVSNIIENKCGNLETGDKIGNIVAKTEIPQIAQKNKDGTYSTYTPRGEDWGSGIIYIPLNNEYDEYLEIYYST